MTHYFFYLFAALSLAGALALIIFRNPVSSAMSMVASFVGLAGIFVTLNAYFVGIIQILVYAGAIMVLFLFIIMLLDLKAAPAANKSSVLVKILAVALPLLFLAQVGAVFQKSPPNKTMPELSLVGASQGKEFEQSSRIVSSLESGRLPDVHLVGKTLFENYNFPLQIVALILLVATIGVVVISRKFSTPPSKD